MIMAATLCRLTMPPRAALLAASRRTTSRWDTTWVTCGQVVVRCVHVCVWWWWWVGGLGAPKAAGKGRVGQQSRGQAVAAGWRSGQLVDGLPQQGCPASYGCALAAPACAQHCLGTSASLPRPLLLTVSLPEVGAAVAFTTVVAPSLVV